MADSRFHHRGARLTLAEVASLSKGELANPSDGDWEVGDVASLEAAKAQDLSFFTDKKYLNYLTNCRAGAILIRPEQSSLAPSSARLVLVSEPYRCFAAMGHRLYPAAAVPPAIHAAAVIDKSAVIAADCSIMSGVVIGKGVKIGKGCQIAANSVIGDGVEIGDYCDIGAGCTISHALIGNRVRLLPGVRIGQAGFGFIMDNDRATPLLQLGIVIIGNFVEIGANSTIDRGAAGDTIIGEGTMIDNLCQIGHNVELGKGCILSAQVGISGSVKVGDGVMMGGQAGVRDHVTIGERAKLAAKAGVMNNVPAHAMVAGLPAMPIKEHFRQVATLKKLAQSKNSK